MIDIKLSELLNSIEILKKLSLMNFKARLAWQIARLLKNAEIEIQNYNEIRNKLINEYGKKDENNKPVIDEHGNYKIEESKLQEFNQEMKDLLDSVVTINAKPISLDLFEDTHFSPMEMTKLEPFIEAQD